jgi:hypothetical protein
VQGYYDFKKINRQTAKKQGNSIKRPTIVHRLSNRHQRFDSHYFIKKKGSRMYESRDPAISTSG